ncbi:MAG: peptide ABC transporter substrate-binding protein [Candidatus Eremiobacteraeota bacterium]|nr:peptide ABC transporter substrate-binding protein [Candidatus Eremiobacteraeota bacterium]
MNVRTLVYRATALIAALLSGCTSSGGSAGAGNGNTFTIAQQREPRSLNPAFENGQSSTQWGTLLFQYLVKFDDKGNLVGDAAAEAPSLANHGISADGRTITYHLRPNLKFADGKPLTADDCVFSIDAINNPRNNVQTRYGYDVVQRADAPNARTCVLHLKRPFAPILTLVGAPQGFPILPKHLLGSLSDFNKAPFNEQPIGSGPYVVERWMHGDRVVMHANPNYYRGKPQIERLVIRFIPDTNTGINLLQTREVDALFNDQDYSNYPQLQAIQGYRVNAAPVSGLGAIIFNTLDPVTQDKRVRHALAAAIDIPTMIQKTYRGAVDTVDAGRGLFQWAYDAKAFPTPAYDPVRARALLDQAGWKVGADGVREKDGRKLDILFIIQAGTPGDSIIGNSVTQYLRAVNVRTSLKQFNVTQIVAPASEGGPVYGGKFQMALYPFVNGDDPDTTDQFACANVPPNGYNKSRLCDPRIDTLLAQGKSTFDIPRRKAIYSNMQVLLWDQLPIVLLYRRRELDVFSSRLQNQTTSIDTAFWNVGAWTLK